MNAVGEVETNCPACDWTATAPTVDEARRLKRKHIILEHHGGANR